MQARRVFALLAVALMIVAAGCASPKTSRARARFHDAPGSFGDLTARRAYVDERIKDLTATGLSREAAEARASREWFTRAPVATQVPTAYELERRKAQADLDGFLADYRAASRR